MKKFTVLLVLVFVFGFIGSSNAALQVIGTADYQHGPVYPVETFNVIYDSDASLVWLDYATTWKHSAALNWVTQLGDGISGYYTLNVTLNDGFTTDIDFGSGWRLPDAGSNPQEGFLNVGELGHLYYDLLGGLAGTDNWFPDGTPFETLYSGMNQWPGGQFDVWTGTPYSEHPTSAWRFDLNLGNSGHGFMEYEFNFTMAVHDGIVTSTVPIPSALFLLGSGLVLLAGISRRNRKP